MGWRNEIDEVRRLIKSAEARLRGASPATAKQTAQTAANELAQALRLLDDAERHIKREIKT